MNKPQMRALYSNNQVLNRIFWGFAGCHVLLWTLAPALFRYNLPMDVLEGYVWGQQLEWGYDKNPLVNAWLTALAIKIAGYQPWALYLCSQLVVLVCFWAVWQLAKQLLSPVYALLSVLFLEAVQYYNFHAIDFNDNTLELGCWALIVLCCYRALVTQRRGPLNWSWLACGFWAGIGLLIKYYTALLLLSLLLLTIIFKENRHCWREPSFYWGGLLCLLIIMPHFIWLTQHDFITVTYAIARLESPQAHSVHAWWQHLLYPWRFLYAQLLTMLPVIIVALPLWCGFNTLRPWRLHWRSQAANLPLMQRRFLSCVALGPLLISLLIAAIAAVELHDGWGAPLLSYWGILLMAYWQPQLDLAALLRFLWWLASLTVVAVAAYSIALWRAQEPSSANFPGNQLASYVTNTWHQQFAQPLAFVAGSRWLASNVAFYSQDHPHVYIDWHQHLSPWIDEAILLKSGAVFIWDEGYAANYGALKRRFPLLSAEQVVPFSWLRARHLAAIKIHVAYLPPLRVGLQQLPILAAS